MHISKLSIDFHALCSSSLYVVLLTARGRMQEIVAPAHIEAPALGVEPVAPGLGVEPSFLMFWLQKSCAIKGSATNIEDGLEDGLLLCIYI